MVDNLELVTGCKQQMTNNEEAIAENQARTKNQEPRTEPRTNKQ